MYYNIMTTVHHTSNYLIIALDNIDTLEVQ